MQHPTLKHVCDFMKQTSLQALAICLACTSALVAQDKASDLETIKQFANPTTTVIAQVDMQRTQLPKELQDKIPAFKEDEPLLKWMESLRSTFAPMSGDRLTIMLDSLFSLKQVPIRIVAKKPANLDVAKLNEGLAAFRFSPAVVQGDYVSTAPVGALSESNKILISNELFSNGDSMVPAALATVKDMPVRILFTPPRYLWSTYEDLMPRLPDSWGGTPTATITEGFQWAAIGFDPASMRLQVTIQSKTAAAAERLVAEFPKLLKAASLVPSMLKFKPVLESLKLDQPVIKQDRIEFTLANLHGTGDSMGVATQLLSALIDPLSTREKMNRFKQLALAIHNYHSAYQVLPPNQAARRADGRSNLSWRVHILPFIDEQKLYSEFKLDEPWDSEHNKKLLDKMPDIFSSYPVPAFAPAIKRGYTTTLAPTGEGTIFGGDKPVPFGLVKDGSSNTIFFVEVKSERAVPWTAPLDYDFPLGDPADGLAIDADGQFMCAMADGSIQLLPGNLPKETLLHLFQMNDGQAIVLP